MLSARPRTLAAQRPQGPWTTLGAALLGLLVLGAGPASADAACPNEAIRTEQHSTYLDDCRAYEMVTPAQKNAADVLADPQRTRAALDGNAIQYSSLTGFGDARGGSYASDYIAVRGPDGVWRTHGISPPQEPTSLFPDAGSGFEPRYMGEFSSDLSRGIFMAKTPLTDAPNVAHALNLYLRSDVLAPGAGTYKLLTDAVSDQGSIYEPSQVLQPAVAGASADFSHVIFESRRSLVTETVGLDPNRPKLYEWVNGTLRLVGMVPSAPEEECGGSGPACVPSVSQAGQGANTASKAYTLTTISQDGRRVIFTVPDPTDFGTEVRYGQLYLRDDQDTPATTDDVTAHITASERTTPDTQQNATFWAASSDGSKVFFTTSEKLTNDDPNNSSDLYRYDLNAPTGSRLTRVSIDNESADNQNTDLANGHQVRGAIGASTDGNTTYFIVSDSTSGGQLIAGGPTTPPVGNAGAQGGARIYRWHLGTLHEIGGINDSFEVDFILGRLGWGLDPKWGRVSSDGSDLAFITQGTDQLLSLYGKPEYDHGTGCSVTTSGAPACAEVYVYDAQANNGTGDLHCASCNPTGLTAHASAEFFMHFAVGGALSTSHLTHALSDDGRFVFFDSDDDLLEEDTNATTDAYSYNTQTEHLSLLSSGTSNSRSIFLDASADGTDAFILTRSQLVASDHDQSNDLYDVRLNGGHPEPLSAAPCDPLAPDSCPAQAAPQPTPATTPQTGAAGPGNSVQRRKRKRHRKHKQQAKRERAVHRDQGGSR